MTKKRGIFARFVVGARSDADIWALSDAAFRLYWSGILWCRDKGNDGYVPAPIVSGLSPVKRASAAAAELKEAGFWIENGNGYWIKNYPDYQDTTDDIARRNAAARTANDARWGDRS